MRYYSTRGQTGPTTAKEAIIKGLAPDGGLFVPAEPLQSIKVENLSASDYRETTTAIFEPFLKDYSRLEIEHAVQSAYTQDTFDQPAITPLEKLSSQLDVLELFHGPTYAFKDIALQILPYLLKTAVETASEASEIVILTATSGDTGKSALEGFRDVPGIKIIVYFPERGVSEIQRLQMTTQEGSNVGVFAVEGNFDDTQSAVKQIFNDQEFSLKLQKSGYRLSSANSINWGRLLPQIVYYFFACRQLINREALKAGDKVNFVVPTGNFGNILAGYYAKCLGLPVNRLICAANRNNVLTDFINTGTYDKRRPFYRSHSPSMDILVSSNLERLLFELTNHDGEKISYWMDQLTETGTYTIDQETHKKIQELFWSDYAGDDETLQTIADTYRNYHYLTDPHTAVGKNVLDKYREKENDPTTSVLLSTASPYKFAGSTLQALFDKNKINNLSEFDMIKILNRETGMPVPVNLAKLEKKPVKHHQVIKPEQMPEHLKQYLNRL
ncbi:MAG: threonine synthase [Bacillota bacterium]